MTQNDWETHDQVHKDEYGNICGISPCVTRCSGGEYKTEESSVCVGCSEGKYLHLELHEGQDATTVTPPCPECPNGYSSGKGQFSCESCEPGKYSFNVHTKCKSCPVGFYQNYSTSYDCTACPLGFSVSNIVRYYFV